MRVMSLTTHSRHLFPPSKVSLKIASNPQLAPQPAQIPPTWNAWIHQMDDRPPPAGEQLDPCTANFIVPGSEKSAIPMYDHVKPHRENPTGKGLTVEYRQPGHWAGGNYRVDTYTSWNGAADKASLGPPNPNN